MLNYSVAELRIYISRHKKILSLSFHETQFSNNTECFFLRTKIQYFFLIKHFFCTFFVENSVKYLVFSIKV